MTIDSTSNFDNNLREPRFGGISDLAYEPNQLCLQSTTRSFFRSLPILDVSIGTSNYAGKFDAIHGNMIFVRIADFQDAFLRSFP